MHEVWANHYSLVPPPKSPDSQARSASIYNSTQVKKEVKVQVLIQEDGTQNKNLTTILYCLFKFLSNFNAFHILQELVQSVPRDWVGLASCPQPVVHHLVPAAGSVLTVLPAPAVQLVLGEVKQCTKLRPLGRDLVY